MKFVWASMFLVLLVASGLGFSNYLHLIQEERVTAVSQLRNRDRKEHLRTLVSAIKEYRSDHSTRLPEGIAHNRRLICRTDVESDCAGLVDLSKLTEEYLVTIPIDPLVLSGSSTGYAIRKESNLVIVDAPFAENEDISISF